MLPGQRLEASRAGIFQRFLIPGTLGPLRPVQWAHEVVEERWARARKLIDATEKLQQEYYGLLDSVWAGVRSAISMAALFYDINIKAISQHIAHHIKTSISDLNMY